MVDIKNALDTYDDNKEFFRKFLDHSFIRQLRKFYQDLDTPYRFVKLLGYDFTSDDLFSLINILLEAAVEPDNASAKACRTLLDKVKPGILQYSMMLKEAKFFNFKNFEAFNHMDQIGRIFIYLGSSGIRTQNNLDIVIEKLKDCCGDLIDKSDSLPHLVATELELLNKSGILDQDTFVVVSIAADTSNPEALEEESATQIALHFFDRPQLQ